VKALLLLVLLFTPGKALAQDAPIPSSVKVLTAANGIASMVDYGVTMYGVGDGSLREANPAMKWAERRPVAMGVVKGAILAGTSVAILKISRKHPKRALLTAILVTSLNSYVAIRNAKMMKKPSP
jgi:hypothetical protein